MVIGGGTLGITQAISLPISPQISLLMRFVHSNVGFSKEAIIS